jgi:hypothetical protein
VDSIDSNFNSRVSNNTEGLVLDVEMINKGLDRLDSKNLKVDSKIEGKGRVRDWVRDRDRDRVRVRVKGEG